MKDNKTIMQAMRKAEQKARSSKLSRLVSSPVRYPLIMGFNKVIYPILKRGVFIKAKTFFGRSFKTLLPAGTDIVLNGMKAHDSEIRLTKFLVTNLSNGYTFIDVGAHYGYYSLLGSTLIGSEGRVHAIEPSVESYALLKENTAPFQNISTYKNAASDQSGEITFYEYPGPYAEYNTTVENAYTETSWISKVKETVNRVQTILLDDLIGANQVSKAIIKIDAEGGELSVLKGLAKSMLEKDLIIVMEYLLSDTADSLHHQAVDLFKKHNYLPHAIQLDGSLALLHDIDFHLKESKLDSDNLVFVKG